MSESPEIRKNARGRLRGRREHEPANPIKRMSHSRFAAGRTNEQPNPSAAMRRRTGVTPIVEARGLTKRFGKVEALTGLALLAEPTTGLDPRSRMELWAAIRGLVADGTDVLLTTQYLEEADQLARQIVIIDHGRVIAAGTPEQLKERSGGDVIVVRPRAAEDLPAVEEALRSVATQPPRLDRDSSTASVAADRGAEQLTAVARLLDEGNIVLDDIGLRRPSLDEVFLTLTGHSAATPTADQDGSQVDAADLLEVS